MLPLKAVKAYFKGVGIKNMLHQRCRLRQTDQWNRTVQKWALARSDLGIRGVASNQWENDGLIINRLGMFGFKSMMI